MSRHLTPLTRRRIAQVAALILLVVAVFQIALALGAPFGDAVLGGHAGTVDGVLTAPYRWMALAQAGLVLVLASLLLRRGGVIAVPRLSDHVMRIITMGIAVLMALNTVANVTAPHPGERAMGLATLTVAVLSALLVGRAERPVEEMQPQG